MGKKTVAAELSDDSPLWQEFDRFKEEGGYQSTSEALREAMRRGLLYEDEEPRGDVEPLSRAARRLFNAGVGAFVLAVAGWLALLAGVARPSAVALVGIAALTGAALLLGVVGLGLAAAVEYLGDEPGERSLLDPGRWFA